MVWKTIHGHRVWIEDSKDIARRKVEVKFDIHNPEHTQKALQTAFGRSYGLTHKSSPSIISNIILKEHGYVSKELLRHHLKIEGYSDEAINKSVHDYVNGRL